MDLYNLPSLNWNVATKHNQKELRSKWPFTYFCLRMSVYIFLNLLTLLMSIKVIAVLNININILRCEF